MYILWLNCIFFFLINIWVLSYFILRVYDNIEFFLVDLIGVKIKEGYRYEMVDLSDYFVFVKVI